MSGMPGFDGKSFEPDLGEVYGIRVWRVSSRGELCARAIKQAAPWTPGVNLATCHAGPSVVDLIDPTGRDRRAAVIEPETAVMVSQSSRSLVAEWRKGGMCAPTTPNSFAVVYRHRIFWNTGEISFHRGEDLRFRSRSHPVPDEFCTCGFYAYLRAHDEQVAQPFSPSLHVTGIVKGYGRTLIGDKGFRCEKAEIVAIQDPRTAKTHLFYSADMAAEAYSAIRANYPDIPVMTSRRELLEFAPLGQITEEKTA